jgi:hypothetical protein
MKLHDIAIARSGDKGNRATLSVIARDPAHYPLLERTLTASACRSTTAAWCTAPSSATCCRTWVRCTSCCTTRWAAASRVRWRWTRMARP